MPEEKKDSPVVEKKADEAAAELIKEREELLEKIEALEKEVEDLKEKADKGMKVNSKTFSDIIDKLCSYLSDRDKRLKKERAVKHLARTFTSLKLAQSEFAVFSEKAKG